MPLLLFSFKVYYFSQNKHFTVKSHLVEPLADAG